MLCYLKNCLFFLFSLPFFELIFKYRLLNYIKKLTSITFC